MQASGFADQQRCSRMVTLVYAVKAHFVKSPCVDCADLVCSRVRGREW